MNKIHSLLLYLICISIFMTALSWISSAAMLNPAITYCEKLGFQYTDDEECKLPNGTYVSAWLFLLGETGQQYSYCRQHNLGIEIVADSTICQELGLEKCAVCVFPDGKKIEVTKAMELPLVTNKCGDKICDLGETQKSCIVDCPSGGKDGFCDRIDDNICDEDCVIQQIPASDVDCPYCGDGKCENKENYGTCQADCPSGFLDSYCDSIQDKRCDPDCQSGEDKDCKLTFWQKILIWLKSLFA